MMNIRLFTEECAGSSLFTGERLLQKGYLTPEEWRMATTPSLLKPMTHRSYILTTCFLTNGH
jgi:hypothetical protein